jgi:hypothetical protein
LTENAVLYALSTLAHTCAALAALVGAVGLYRIGLLVERRRNVLEELERIINNECHRRYLW